MHTVICGQEKRAIEVHKVGWERAGGLEINILQQFHYEDWVDHNRINSIRSVHENPELPRIGGVKLSRELPTPGIGHEQLSVADTDLSAPIEVLQFRRISRILEQQSGFQCQIQPKRLLLVAKPRR